MKIFINIFLLIFSYCVSAQKVDYLKVRDDLVVLTCGEPIDSVDLSRSIRNLESFDTNRIKKNIDHYYLDLGGYYWLAGGLSNQAHADKAIAALNKALYHSPHNRRALWDLAFVYGFLHECEKARGYFAEYHKYTPLEYESAYSAQQEKELLVKCESKN